MGERRRRLRLVVETKACPICAAQVDVLDIPTHMGWHRTMTNMPFPRED